MFKEKETEEILKIIDEVAEEIKKEVINDSKNHTLENLRQKLINDMYDKKVYCKEDVEILKILFEHSLNEKLDIEKIARFMSKPKINI